MEALGKFEWVCIFFQFVCLILTFIFPNSNSWLFFAMLFFILAIISGIVGLNRIYNRREEIDKRYKPIKEIK